MTSEAKTVKDYLSTLPEDRLFSVNEILNNIRKKLPKGFQEGMQYGMIGYYVPHSIYPSGYHCDPKQPLPFMGLASQKNSVNFYHMGIYAVPEYYDWFVNEYSKFTKKKLDIGKSCMRFKKQEDIPLDLIGELVSKISVEQWITIYEKNYKK
jgi:hypothetical protein